VHRDDPEVGVALRAGRRGRAGAPGATGAEALWACVRRKGQTRRGGRAATRASGVGHAAHPRRAGALLGAGGERDRGASHPARGGADRRDAVGGAGTRARPAALRAGGAQPDVAVGHLHVSAPTPRAAVPDSLHGRPLALHRVVGAGAPSAVGPGDGGAVARHRGVRDTAGDPHGPRSAVYGVARRDGFRAGAPSARHPSRQEPPSAPADARQGGAILEDTLGGIPESDGVCRLRRLRAPPGALRGRVQLPAAAPRHRGTGARRPLLPVGAASARSHREERVGQRATAGARAAGAQALLPGRPAGRPGPDDRGGRQRPARAGGRRAAADHSIAQGVRR